MNMASYSGFIGWLKRAVPYSTDEICKTRYTHRMTNYFDTSANSMYVALRITMLVIIYVPHYALRYSLYAIRSTLNALP